MTVLEARRQGAVDTVMSAEEIVSPLEVRIPKEAIAVRQEFKQKQRRHGRDMGKRHPSECTRLGSPAASDDMVKKGEQ